MMQGSHRNGTNFRPRAAAARALRSVRHAVARGWRGALAVVLAMLLVWQSAGSSGVAYAITAGAQTIAAATSKMIEDTPADETDTPAVTDGTTTGGSSEETTGSDNSTAAVQTESSDQTEPSDAEETTEDETTTQKAEVADASTTGANGSTTAQTAVSPDASEQDDQTTVDESTAPGNTDESAGTADEPATTDDAEELQATPRDWTGMVNNLKLSTPDRLVIDTDAVAQLVKQSIAAAAEAQEATVGEQAADDQAADDQTSSDQANDGQAATDKTADQEAANNTQAANDPAATGPSTTSVGNAAEPAEITLPDELPATLSLAFELDPTADPQQDAAAKDAAAHTTVIANDTFEVTLPAGVTLANTDPFDVYQCNDQNKDTTVRIAKATPSADGTKLTIKFVDAVDTATSETYYLGAPSDDELAEHPGTVFATAKARLALDVKVDAELIGDEATTVEWTLQQPAADVTGEAQKATLELPARDDLIASLDLEATEPADTEDATSEEEPAETEDTASVAEDAKNGVLEVEEDTKTALSAVQELNRALITLLADDALTKDPAYKLSSYTDSVGFTTQWADNNSDSRPKDAIKDATTLWFSLGDDKLIQFTQANAKQYLGMDEDEYNKIINSVSITNPNINTVEYSLSKLPTELAVTAYKLRTDEQGFPVYDSNDEPVFDVDNENSYSRTISWSYTFDTSADVFSDYYVTTDENNDDLYYFQLLDTNIRFTVTLKTGDLTYDDFDEVPDAELYLEYVVNNVVQEARFSVDELMADTPEAANKRAELGIESITWDADAHQLVVVAPRYTTDGSPIEWRVRYERDDEQTKDYFLATYDNSNVPNRGTDVSAAYNGGAVVITHAGTTSFTAEKQWLDNDNAANRRGDVSFSLWRYSGDGTAATASQVRDANGDFVTITVQPEDANADGVVDLGTLLEEQYPNLVLDKYDSDGFPFVYGIREDTQLAGYETVFGKVDAETGEVSDEAPNYYDIDGTTTKDFTEHYTRGNTDRLTYNGGTVSNRLTGTKTVTATKTWSVAAFADQVKDITCTFTLQREVTNEDGSKSWIEVTDSDGKTITQDLKGFSAEQLSLDVTGQFDQYDENGEEITYRWVETGVSQEGYEADDVNFTPVEGTDGAKATFTLHLRANDTNSDTVEAVQFTSTTETDKDTGKTVITNTFDNTVDEHVDKLWMQGDGETYDYKQVDFPDLADSCTVRLYQGTTLIGKFVLDGVIDDESHPQTGGLVGGFDGVDVYEYEPYRLNIDDLPLYAADGSRYVYRVVEEEPRGWDSTREYDAKTHTTTIRNSTGPGEGTDFHLIKTWVDGEDAAHRLTSYVQVSAAENIYNLDKELVYPKGTVLFGKNGAISDKDLELSEANGWFLEFTVTGAGGVSWKQLEVQETKLVDESTGDEYPVANSVEDAKDEYGDADWINKGWDEEYPGHERPRVATNDHVYEVTTDGKDAEEEGTFGEQLLEVRNRRIGLIDLTVEKTWKDEGADASERPNAWLFLTVDDPDAVFSYDDEGNVLIQLTNGNKLPIFKDKGGEEETTEHYTRENATIVDANGDPCNEGTVLRVAVDTSGDSSTYYFSGLPKYTGDGDVVHYTVSEKWKNENDHGDYTSSMSAGDYLVGERHFHDTQEWTATNRRTGTTTAHFHKEWDDVYVNAGSMQRPDIYLTLYKVTSENNYQPVEVSDYVHWLWTAGDDSSASNRASQYSQTCTIDGLQKYDSNGFEIIYYAKEEMASDGTSLDYAPVTFTVDGSVADDDFAKLLDTSKIGAAGSTAERDDTTGTAIADDKISDCSGGNYAVRSGGTFNNLLRVR